MYLEGAFSARPAATQIVMRRQFKAETTVQRRIAQRHHCGIAELIKRNKLYTGITTDVERRYQQHQSGKGAKALRGKGELTLAFSAPVGDRSLALRAEYRVKQLTKRQKERLVAEGAGFAELLSSLQTPKIKSD